MWGSGKGGWCQGQEGPAHTASGPPDWHCQGSDLACDKQTSEGCGLDFACGFLFICEVFSYPRNQALPNSHQTKELPTLTRMRAILPFFTVFMDFA